MMPAFLPDLAAMRKAICLAEASANDGEIPVGAVIVQNGTMIAQGQNRREVKQNALLHAEIEAIDAACKHLGRWRLNDCDLYVTLEPCPMCAGAILNARIRRVIFGAYDQKAGACGSVLNLFSYPLNHTPEIWGGILEIPCSQLLKDFFASLR